MTTSVNRYVLSAALAATALLAHAGDASARTHFNSLTRMKTSVYKNLSLADVNGDGLSDLVGYTQDEWGFKISVGSADWQNKAIASFDTHGRPEWSGIYIGQIFTGHFDDKGRESICFRSAGRPGSSDWYWQSIYCFTMYGDQLYQMSSEPSPNSWHAGYHYAVGDINGDGYDELVVHSPWNIDSLDIYKYERGPTYGFWHTDFDKGQIPTNWSGNLTDLYIGDFGDFPGQDGSGRRDDFLLHNRATGEMRRLDSRVWGGKTVFWWAWSNSGPVAANEEVGVADADGNGFEDVILHDTLYGNIRFLDATSGALKPLPYRQPEQGQLPWFGTAKEHHVYWGLMKYHFFEGGGTNVRDDAFVYFNESDSYGRYDGRYCAPGKCGTSYGYRTYWWYYTAPVSAIKAALGMSYLE